MPIFVPFDLFIFLHTKINQEEIVNYKRKLRAKIKFNLNEAVQDTMCSGVSDIIGGKLGRDCNLPILI